MIRYGDDGRESVLDCSDWTPAMERLASALNRLPLRPGTAPPTGTAKLEFAVDELRQFCDYRVIGWLWDLIPELDYRPDGYELFALGKYQILTNMDFERLLGERRRDRRGPTPKLRRRK